MAPTKNKSAIHTASLLTAMAATGFSTASLAAPPLGTDDASTLDPGACQVETARDPGQFPAIFDLPGLDCFHRKSI